MNKQELKQRIEKKLIQKLNLKWNRHTESWDCPGSIVLNNLGLTKLPIKLGVIKGKLNVNNNNLKDWINFPSMVEKLIIENNKFTSLEGMPDTVEFSFHDNRVTSLRGLSKYATSIWANNNLLTNLDYCNEDIQSIDVDNNRITSLKSPIKRITDLWCDNNLLTQIDDIPNNIHALYVQNNKITELKIPKANPHVQIHCYGNPITAWDNTLNYNTLIW